MLVLRLVHFLGMALWIGGAAAAMVGALSARAESNDVRLGAYRLLAHIHTRVISVGALLTAGTGLVMTMRLVQAGAGAAMGTPRIMIMQTAGLLGAALVLFVGLPTATKIARLASLPAGEPIPAALEQYRKRQAMVSSIAGVLALVALFAGVVLS